MPIGTPGIAVNPQFAVHVLGADLDAGDILIRSTNRPDWRTSAVAKLGRVASRPCVHVELELAGHRLRAPMRPTGACTLWARMAAITSDGARLRLVRRCVSNQIRIE